MTEWNFHGSSSHRWVANDCVGSNVTQCPDCNFSAPAITLAFLILTLATVFKFFALSLDFSLVGVRLALLIGLLFCCPDR